MALQYGVLRARFDRAKREDGLSTPHLQIRALDSTGQPWRVAVNVQSQDHSEVVFWIVDPLVGHPIVDSLATRPSGFSPGRAQCDHVAGLRHRTTVRLLAWPGTAAQR